MTVRLCEWCGGEIPASKKPGTLTCMPAHRLARWKFLNDQRSEAGSPPPEPPWPDSPLYGERDRRTRSRTGEHARSGLQVSHAKAVREVALAVRQMFNTTEHAAVLVAEKGLRAALSPKQRERLEARDG